MKNTINYNFNLPEQTDFYNIDDINTNFNKLDNDLKQIDDITKSTVASEAGVHGLRYFKNNLQFKNLQGEWENIIKTPTYTVIIDTTDPNPETSLTYADDAIGMTAGSTEWDKIFGYYPVLLKNGEEIGKLNPNDFTKFIDGTPVDITTGVAGDVMMAYPRMGVNIITQDNIIKVQLTPDQNKTGFSYYAHERDNLDKKVFYIGCYPGFVDNDNKLRSLSNKTITTNISMGDFLIKAKNNGVGYDIFSFYQLTYLQVLYILKYKNLNSQMVIGQGITKLNAPIIPTGSTDTKGLNYGTQDTTQSIKCLGLEDLWGNYYQFITGIFVDTIRNIYTATNNFNHVGNEYILQGNGGDSNISGFAKQVRGDNITGFIIKNNLGSSTTYWCDYGYLSGGTAGSICTLGGGRNLDERCGIFNIDINTPPTVASTRYTARLMYL